MTDEREQLAGSLLDEEIETIGTAKPARPARPSWMGVLHMSPVEIASAVAGWVRRRPRLAGGIAAAVLIGSGVWAWQATRIKPPPDYTTARLDVLFEYTLLTDDFNRLPVEKRLELLGQLIERLRNMAGNDSILLALFASMIMGEAREQLQENISRLAIDVADKYAATYDATAPAEVKQVYLEDVFVELQSTMSYLSGRGRERTREEILSAGRRQAQRDLNRFQQGRVGAGEVLQVFDIMNNEVGRHMSGHQKMRVSTMFRDMTEMLRSGP